MNRNMYIFVGFMGFTLVWIQTGTTILYGELSWFSYRSEAPPPPPPRFEPWTYQGATPHATPKKLCHTPQSNATPPKLNLGIFWIIERKGLKKYIVPTLWAALHLSLQSIFQKQCQNILLQKAENSCLVLAKLNRMRVHKKRMSVG